MRIFLKAIVGIALCVGVPAQARGMVDCPLRDQAYSVDAPIMDVLLNPAAKRALDSEAPTVLQIIPAPYISAQAPSISSVLTARRMFRMAHLPDSTLAALDRRLAIIPVTAADKAARCARYDTTPINLIVPKGAPRLLLFQKITGFRDGPSVEAGAAAVRNLADRHGWALVVTDKGAAMTAANLRKFDAVIWNNVSGDVLTVAQRQAFRRYIEGGGGFVGFHGSGGDPVYFWKWYTETLLGADFKGHATNPQFRDVRVVVDDPKSAIVSGLPASWTMRDEWYSFEWSPRNSGSHILLALDEASYVPPIPDDMRMGDHPIAWTRCVHAGRVFYSAIGHRPDVYTEPRHVELLDQAITWAAGAGATRCAAGKEVARTR